MFVCAAEVGSGKRNILKSVPDKPLMFFHEIFNTKLGTRRPEQQTGSNNRPAPNPAKYFTQNDN